MAFSFEKINSVCLCVCVCYLKSFIAELCIFLLHSSCINSSIIALYDEQLPPSSNQVPASWARLRCKFQVIAASHTLIHTHTYRQRTYAGTCIHMWLIRRRLRFCMPWLPHILSSKDVVLLAILAYPVMAAAAAALAPAAALKCRTCLVSKISVIQSVLWASPTWFDACCRFEI